MDCSPIREYAPRHTRDAASLTEVLIIEEDDEVGASLTRLLTERGYGTLAVRTGPKGLDLLRSGVLPRVIVLDPFTTNGWRAFRAAQNANPAWASIPVIVGIPRHQAIGDDESSAHREHHLPKPLVVEDLLALVNRYCRPWN